MSKKVLLDPGHGGSDPGAVGGGLQEKNLTLQIARRTGQTLEANYDVTVHMTRTTDVTMSLQQRTDHANRIGADYFCSIHINAGGGTGYEDFIHSNLSDSSNTARLRHTIHGEIQKVLNEYGIRNRGKKKANFHVLRESRMPAMLSETLFIDTAADQQLLRNNRFLTDIADAHAHGIARALGLKKKASGGNAPTTPSLKPTSPSSPTQSVGLLRIGSRGQAVTDLQTTLKNRGYRVGTIDGVFGPRTDGAVRDFQSDAQIAVDGIVGTRTRDALVDMAKYPGHYIRLQSPYMRGRQVRAVQRKSGTKVDGIFGPNSERSVRTYQSNNRLQVDGIVGPATWRKMFN